MHGGILIRSIENLSTGELIEGSCNCVTAILKQFDVSEVNDFLEKTNIVALNIFDSVRVLFLRIS